ncbi:hypothetical protein [Fibrobacter sp. UWEL]|uniref:hypothetical protein n=1 Tax=Fibrobacter sp. UWEL TaxID=1896209 RepID=UPI0009203654|nr:hypothetical protein [Fibrobacter sp. UWEL]SHK36328.1 hypothetical protein SAMN05720468_101217 [Fibrobacter sp. UWEL]
MKRIIFITFAAAALSFADRVVYDNSMAGQDDSENNTYEDRGSFGPYVEFNNIKMSNVNYSYKVHDMKYNITIDNSYIYGASGSLPVTEWFDLYVMAGYQYIGVSHHPRNKNAAYDDLAGFIEDFEDFGNTPLDSSDIDGRHQIHTALFQLGCDFALPLVESYTYQFMLKPYAFVGALFGKTFFSDNTKFLSPVIYGYAYGAGVRMAWHRAVLSAGVRNSHEYFHTYFERKISETRDGDEFMLDFDTYFQPYVSLGITLF